MKRLGTVIVFVVGILLGHLGTYYYMSRPAPKVAQATRPAETAKPAEPPAPARMANVNFDREPLWA